MSVSIEEVTVETVTDDKELARFPVEFLTNISLADIS